MYLRTLNKATCAVIIFNYMVTIFGLTNLRNQIFGSWNMSSFKKPFKLEAKENNTVALDS